MKFRALRLRSMVLVMTVGSWIAISHAADESSREPNLSDLNLAPAVPEAPAAPIAPAIARQPPELYQKMQQMQQLQGRADIAAKVLAGIHPRTNLAGNIRTAAEAVRDAKGDEAKAAAQKNLAELLGKYFDEDTKRRQEELTQIEERLAKLRELLERRRSKKQDILELQMKVALNEAEGLGFYDSEHSAGPKISNGFFRTTIEGSPASSSGSAESPYTTLMKTTSDDRKPEPKKSKSESKSKVPTK
jgi:hypothetical protein